MPGQLPGQACTPDRPRGLLKGGVSLRSPGPPGGDAGPEVTAENPHLDSYVALVPHGRGECPGPSP